MYIVEQLSYFRYFNTFDAFDTFNSIDTTLVSNINTCLKVLPSPIHILFQELNLTLKLNRAVIEKWLLPTEKILEYFGLYNTFTQ